MFSSGKYFCNSKKKKIIMKGIKKEIKENDGGSNVCTADPDVFLFYSEISSELVVMQYFIRVMW